MAPGGMAGRALVCPLPLGAQPGVPGRGRGGAGQGPAVALQGWTSDKHTSRQPSPAHLSVWSRRKCCPRPRTPRSLSPSAGPPSLHQPPPPASGHSQGLFSRSGTFFLQIFPRLRPP